MKRHVKLLARARGDADDIFSWIAERSPKGAASWHQSFQDAAATLSDDAERHAIAPELTAIPEEVREFYFRTRHGRRYRILFVIVGAEVRILRIRGPGQPPVMDEDLR
jgi:plasmid stabilization system protein ParE